jgi:hypothetical protein
VPMKRTIVWTGAVVIWCAICAGSVSAQIYTESGDTGGTLGTAQDVGAGITMIMGALSDLPDNVDLYRLELPATLSLVAEVTSYSASGGNPANDSMLYLFDSTGAGIFGNDDLGGGSFLSRITTGSLAAGTYYLGFSDFATLALDQESDVWYAGDGVPPASWDTLAGWTEGSDFGPYTITLNTETIIPETSSILTGLLLCGGAVLAMRRRKRAALP